LGRGHVDFKSILLALEEIDYKGMISVEAFSTKLSAANIWRKMFDNEMQLVKESYQYLKSI
jgi:D-psicose/D-tagatose/L-ribulose 3-epimerase